MTEMVFGTVHDRTGDPILPRWWRSVDRWSLAAAFMLFAVGLLLTLAAGVPLAEKTGRPPYHYVRLQAFYGALALFVMLSISILSPRNIRRLGVVGFCFAFLALISLWFVGLDHGKGATRWLSIGGISVQPSEFVKPGYVALAAWFIAASQELGGPPGKRLSFALMAVLGAILVAQPDYGQTSLIFVTWIVMFFVGGGSLVGMSAAIGAALMGGVVAYNVSPHFARRINGFLTSDVDPLTQIGFATHAIQEGGFFGVGVGEGTVKRSLPDAHTDFIIAVAAEEYGLLLVFIIIILFAAIVLRALSRLQGERDAFARIAGTGLACMFGLQAMVNMGVAVRLLPAKGMTLPFISYGGSSMLATGIVLGMLFALTRRRPQGEFSAAMGGTK